MRLFITGCSQAARPTGHALQLRSTKCHDLIIYLHSSELTGGCQAARPAGHALQRPPGANARACASLCQRVGQRGREWGLTSRGRGRVGAAAGHELLHPGHGLDGKACASRISTQCSDDVGAGCVWGRAQHGKWERRRKGEQSSCISKFWLHWRSRLMALHSMHPLFAPPLSPPASPCISRPLPSSASFPQSPSALSPRLPSPSSVVPQPQAARHGRFVPPSLRPLASSIHPPAHAPLPPPLTHLPPATHLSSFHRFHLLQLFPNLKLPDMAAVLEKYLRPADITRGHILFEVRGARNS